MKVLRSIWQDLAAVAAIIVAILAVIWALLLLIGSLPAIFKAVNITRTVG